MFFDLSPENICNKYGEDKGEARIVAATMLTAAAYQPSIIYIDEAHKIWAGKAPKRKGVKKKKKSKKDPTNPLRILPALKKWHKKFLNYETKVTIIGCTSEPERASYKKLKKFFKYSVWFPYPDYQTRRTMWKTFC